MAEYNTATAATMAHKDRSGLLPADYDKVSQNVIRAWQTACKELSSYPKEDESHIYAKLVARAFDILKDEAEKDGR